MFTPGIIKNPEGSLDITKAVHSEEIVPAPWTFVISRFHCACTNYSNRTVSWMVADEVLKNPSLTRVAISNKGWNNIESSDHLFCQSWELCFEPQCAGDGHPVSSIKKAPACQVGGYGFNSWPDQFSSSLNNRGEIAVFVIIIIYKSLFLSEIWFLN